MVRLDEEILTFLREYTATHGYSPSIRDIQEGLSLGSIDTIHRRLRHLRAHDRVEWQPNRARTLRVKQKTAD